MTMPHYSEPRHEREQERRIKAVHAEMNEQERTTRNGLFWLSILAAVAFIGICFCLVNSRAADKTA
jgi:hypothetical protein